ncbi:MAG: GAF domain-containing protein [Polyangiaceae bacterium]|nr:GAF domain-containing protein [Polyangiaceae bacterium]
MQLVQRPFPASPALPPPLWYVSNGETTVGPVRSDLLMRGVWFDRIPGDCWVREARWREYRALDQVREVASTRRARRLGFDAPRIRRRPPLPEALEGSFAAASDPVEVATLLLNALMDRTGAELGAIHRSHRRYDRPVTTCVRGAGLLDLLERPIERDDPAILVARSGRVVFGKPDDGPLGRRISARLAIEAPVAGVALVPMVQSGQLVAVLELGRSDHAFRRRDVELVRALTHAAVARLSSPF